MPYHLTLKGWVIEWQLLYANTARDSTTLVPRVCDFSMNTERALRMLLLLGLNDELYYQVNESAGGAQQKHGCAKRTISHSSLIRRDITYFQDELQKVQRYFLSFPFLTRPRHLFSLCTSTFRDSSDRRTSFVSLLLSLQRTSDFHDATMHRCCLSTMLYACVPCRGSRTHQKDLSASAFNR